MDHLLDSQQSISNLFAGLIIALCLHFLLKICDLFFTAYKTRNAVTEKSLQENSVILIKLETRFKTLEHELSDVLKMRKDFNRIFRGIRALSGDRWPAIRKEIMQDEPFEP